MPNSPENEPQGPEMRPLGPFRLEFDTGYEVICNKFNTAAFIHSEEPWGDHLFIHHPEVDGVPEHGDYVFREQLSNFDEIVMRMDASDWNIIESDKLNEDDLEAYEEFKAIKQKNLERAQKINAPEIVLTPRQENLAGFVAYLLLHEHLTAQEFHGSGDLFI